MKKAIFLVLTNSAKRLFFGQVSDANEDWEKANALAAPFGISYESVPFTSTAARVASAHPLTENLSGLRLIAINGLPFNLQEGEMLAELGGQVALRLVDYGGAVVVDMVSNREIFSIPTRLLPSLLLAFVGGYCYNLFSRL